MSEGFLIDVPCAHCAHTWLVHVPGTGVCGFHLGGEFRCTCPGFEEAV